jgi:hypothetical protein
VLADERLAASDGLRERGRGARLVRKLPHDPLAEPVGEHVERGQHGWRGPAFAARFFACRSSYAYACLRVPPDPAQPCGFSVFQAARAWLDLFFRRGSFRL